MSNPIYYPNRDMLGSRFPTNWSLLKRLMWVRIMQGGSIPPEYETVTGNPVTFETVRPYPLKSLLVSMSPVQDLHGYDAPWPAGGGVNLLSDISRTGTSGTMTAVYGKDSVVLTGTADGDGGRNYLRSEYFSLTAGTYYFKIWNADVHSKAQPSVFLQNGTSLVSVDSGTRAFTLAGDSSSMNIGLNCAKDSEYNYSAQFTISKTDISAYSPYSNLCPISGWSSLTVEQRGKNLLEKSIEQFTNVPKELASCFFLKAGSYAASFDSISNATSWRFAIMMRDSDGNNLSDADHKPNPYMAWNTTIQGWLGGSNSTTKNVSFTLVDDCYIRVVLASGDTSASTTVTNGMLNIGSTATAYTPYNPLSRSIYISLGDTYYSGTLDVVTGVLTVDMAEVDLGDLTWTYQAANTRFYSNGISSDVKAPSNNSNPVNAICECYAVNSFTAYSDKEVSCSTSGTLFIKDSAFTDKDAFVAAMGNYALVYELATPQTIQLTPQQVSSLLGENVLFSDANGDLTVEYRSN